MNSFNKERSIQQLEDHKNKDPEFVKKLINERLKEIKSKIMSKGN